MLSASGRKGGDIVATFPDRQFLLRGRREAADTEHRSQVGHSYYDITANCFLTVVKLAASSHYHAVYF